MTLLRDLYQQASPDASQLPAFMAGAAAVLVLARQAAGPFARDDLLALLEREVQSFAASSSAEFAGADRSPVVL